MRHALLIAALLALGCTEEPRAEPVEAPATAESSAPPSEAAPDTVAGRLGVIDGAPPEAVLRYFSGNYPNLMNHPAIWWTRGEEEVVVSGRGTLERFERAQIDEALARYRALLIERGYEPEDHEAPEPSGGMVAVRMEDLLPSESEARSAFTPRQFEAIRNVAATPLYRHMTGNDGSAHDRVAMYASSMGLAVVEKESDETFPMEQSSRAFAAFRAATTSDAAADDQR